MLVSCRVSYARLDVVRLSEVFGDTLLHSIVLLSLLAQIVGRTCVLPGLLAELSDSLSLILELVFELC